MCLTWTAWSWPIAAMLSSSRSTTTNVRCASVRSPSRSSATSPGGYPYFIQFICREVYDVFIQAPQQATGTPAPVPMDGITQKLDTDFFAGRWARATDRQRQLLWCVAHLENADGEFTVQEVVAETEQRLDKSFSSSHANQMLAALGKAGLIYKNRWGKESLAVPLFDRFILRQASTTEPGQLA